MPSKRGEDRNARGRACPKPRKRAWNTKRLAQRAAIVIGEAYHKKFYVYQCDGCGKWHLTRQPQ
jgi:hypothetical protein